ncbi:MAG: HAD family hydrolase [Actinomycetaceae bacterium]|nr:HAD family hydrolase [Actinomycetaceae bacterium]
MSNPLLTPPPTTLAPIPFETLVKQALEAMPPDLEGASPRLLIALDVDGTLLTTEGATDVTKSRIAAMQEAGAHVVIATGRGVGATAPLFKQVGIHDGWAVSSNGAITLRIQAGTVEIIERQVFDPAPVIEQIAKHYPQALLGVEDADSTMRVSQEFPPNELLEDWQLDSIEGLSSIPVSKLIVRIPDMDRDEFVDRMGELDLSMVEPAIGWTSWMDVNPPGTTKASALEALRTKLSIPSTGTVSVGDGTNDMAMLRWAYHGVAMAGATDEVRSSADTVTGPVEYDGAGAIMEALLRKTGAGDTD